MNAAANLLILVICEAENTAKRIENHLRNAGHAVRTLWMADLRDVETLLKEKTPTLLLCSEGPKGSTLKTAVEQCRHYDEALPVLLLSARYTADNTLMALEAGAHDQVSDEDARYLRHLQQVCLREIEAYQNHLQLRQTRAQTEAVESRTKHLLTESTDAVASVSEGILTEANPAFITLFKYTKADDLIGQPLMDCIAADSQAKLKDYLKQLLKGKASDQALSCTLLRADNTPLTIDVAFSLNKAGDETAIQLLIRAPKPAAATEHSGAAARIPFMKRLKAAIEQPSSQVQAALLITVDDFAALESRLGFTDSEEALLKLMEWLRNNLGPKDVVGRVSSDELALIVTRPVVSDISALCESFCQRLQKEVFTTRHKEAHLTVSIAAYPFAKDEKADDIINQLTREARKLSSSGGNRSAVIGATAQDAEVARQEALKATQIKKAIEGNRFRLAYQSISSLEGDPRQHLDILLRMLDEKGQEVAAAEFIETAEKFDLIRVLDRWVTAAILQQLARRGPIQERITCFVKLSEDTLKDAEAFVTWLSSALKGRALQPGELVFSFKEAALQNHIRKGKALAKALRDLGADVAIERFGKISSSVQLLDHIPAHFIKLDQDFTRDFNNAEMQKLMASLMEVAKRKHIKVIVCHVEDANLMARLWQLGVNLVQGFLIQEPALFTENAGR